MQSAVKPHTHTVMLEEEKCIQLVGDDNELHFLSCKDVAKLAICIHENSYFFLVRHGLVSYFSRDQGGSGEQGLNIMRKGKKYTRDTLLEITFMYTLDKDIRCLYEYEMVQDQAKDYMPTVSKGMHWFYPRLSKIKIDPNSEEFGLWRYDAKRLEKLKENESSLTSIIEGGFEVQVNCSKIFEHSDGTSWRCKGEGVLGKSDLEIHHAAGLNMQDLKSRLTCKKCGTHGAYLTIF